MKRLFALFAFAFIRIAGLAQQVDESGDVLVSFRGTVIWNSYASAATAQVTCYGEGNPSSITASRPSGGGAGTTPQLNARLIPGKSYQVAIAIDNAQDPAPPPAAPTGAFGFYLKAYIPEGFTVVMNGVQWNNVSLSTNPYARYSTVYCSVMLRRVLGDPGLRAGMATPLNAEKTLWQLSLGSLTNGNPAGSLAFNSALTSASLASVFTRTNLLGDVASTDVQLIGDVANNNVLRQVIAPQVCVDIVGALNSGTIELKCYHPSQRSAGVDGNGCYSFSGDPFSWFFVQPQATDAAGVIISNDLRDLATPTSAGLPVVRTLSTKLSRTGTTPSFTYTVEDWHTGTTALVKTIQARSGNTETTTIKNDADTVASTASRTFSTLVFGEEIGTQVTGSTNQNTTTFDYYSADNQSLAYGKIKTTSTTAGNWQGFEYDPAGGRVKTIHGPFKNSDVGVPAGFPVHTGVTTDLAYSSDPWGFPTRISSTETKVNGTTVAKSTTSYADETPFAGFSTHTGLIVVNATRTDYADASSTLVTTTKSFAESVGSTDDFYRMLVHSRVGPDGAKQSFAYQRGTWNGTAFTASANSGLDSGPASRAFVFTGTQANPGGGATLYSSYSGYPLDPLYLINGKSTLEITQRDAYAYVVRTEKYVWSSGAWNLVGWTNYTYNLSGLLKSRAASNGTLYSANYSADRKTDETDESGVTVSYTYDAAGRPLTVTKTSGPITTFTYDASDHVLTETLSAAGTAETIYSSHSYDDAGRATEELPAGMAAITHTYDVAGRSHTITYPDGGTRTEYAMADGKTDHVDGSAAIAEYYSYVIESDGRQTAQVNYGSSKSLRWQKKSTDWIGRATSSTRPGFGPTSQAAYVESNGYEAGTGRLIKSNRTGLAPVVYQYDAMGALFRSGLDIGDNGLVNASNDRISEGDQSYELYNSEWWLRQEARIYPTANDGTIKTNSITRKRLTGYTGNRIEEIQETDAEGNVTVSTIDINRTTATVTKTVSRPGMTNSQVETIVNGLSTSVTSHDGLTSSAQYDALQRAWKNTDWRNNTTTTTYKYGTALVESIVDATNTQVSLISYDAMARKQWVQDANGQKTHFAYDQRGQLTKQWGGASYPFSYGYDAVTGERTSVNTYRNAPSGESDTWPSVGVADTTTWTFDPATGLLWKKTDAATQVTEFDYNSRGQTSTRKWARGLASNGSVPVTTSYTYDDNTGELLSQTYNDQAESIKTPNVTYTYTRLGQIATVVDGTGSRAFGYNASSPWRQDSETLDASFYASRVVTRTYDGSTSIGGTYGPYTSGFVKGRYTGYDLGVAGNTSRDQHISYATSNLARFVGVNTRVTSGSARDYVYSYQAGTRLLAGYTMGSFTVSRGYELQRDLITNIQASWNGSPVSRYDYNYNAMGQRYTAKQSGSAFADYATSSYNNTFQAYTYNARGELETSAQYGGDTPPAVGTAPTASAELPGRRYEFRYDSMGNRKTAGSTGSSATGDNEYSTNNLNQYNGRENNTVRVNGTAAANATVNVAGAPSTAKNGRAWGTEIVPANSTGPVQGTANIYGVVAGASGGLDQIKIDSKTYFVPRSWQTFTYDADGNMTGDGMWIYSYDAENRLVRMTTDTAAQAAGLPNRILYFSYDYQGRRVEKRSVNTTLGSDVTRRYLYDGYNLIAETDSGGALQRLFTWGLDVLGTPTAAGGVGALLQIDDLAAGKTLAAAYDGNGNIAALINVGSGVTEAAYEYNSFGELLRADGVYAKLNPFRFSTKWQDDESGLINYGFRYYSATLGRFINRDPIGEKGGLNLYGFCANDGVNHWDYMGQSWLSKLWNKFKHTIISVVLSVIPVVGPILATMYNVAVGAYYGGIKGMLMALAGGGYLGGFLQVAAGVYGVYQTFRHGKDRNRL